MHFLYNHFKNLMYKELRLFPWFWYIYSLSGWNSI